MKRFALGISLTAALAAPLRAQEAEEDGPTLMERGAQMFFEGLMQEMEPALDDLRGMAEDIEPAFREFWSEMGPAFAQLLGQIDDLSNYHAPEMLPNGDIIIRRKTPLEPEAAPESEIEI